MKKILLSLILGICQLGYSQLTCATASVVTAGTHTAPSITGTYLGTCAGSGAATTPNALWYSYTATANGEVTISSDFPTVNNGTTYSNDTRLSIISGTCTAPVCYSGNDDVSNSNYLSEVTFPVAAGTTYLISWDNRWSSLGFQWSLAFNASSCIRPNDYGVTDVTNVTSTTANANWTAAIGSPASYDIQYGASGFALGSGTIGNTTTTSGAISGAAGSNLDYYIRSNCGTSQSEWIGPFGAYLAVTLPFTNSFETPNFGNGFDSSSWSLGNATGGAQNGTIYYFSSSSTTAVSNAQLYSRAINLSSGEAVTLTFWTRLGSATGTAQTLKVYVNTTNSMTSATQVGSTITVSGATYVQQTVTYTASTAGIYYFIFSNESPIVTTATSLRLDNVNITSVLGAKDFAAATIKMYPNPVQNELNISSDNTLVKSVEIFDLNGRKIMTSTNNTASSEFTVNLSNLESGVYMVTVFSSEGNKTVKKFIKE